MCNFLKVYTCRRHNKAKFIFNDLKNILDLLLRKLRVQFYLFIKFRQYFLCSRHFQLIHQSNVFFFCLSIIERAAWFVFLNQHNLIYLSLHTKEYHQVSRAINNESLILTERKNLFFGS